MAVRTVDEGEVGNVSGCCVDCGVIVILTGHLASTRMQGHCVSFTHWVLILWPQSSVHSAHSLHWETELYWESYSSEEKDDDWTWSSVRLVSPVCASEVPIFPRPPES